MRLTPHPFSLRQLQYVLAVAEHSSFRQAAQACHVAQPSLSAQVAQVEELLGVKLFERDRRRVALTPEGSVLVQRARQLLRAADEMVDCAAQLGDPLAGTLRLGIIPTAGPYLLPEVVPALRRAVPRLSFAWTEEKTAVLLTRLRDAELDGVILARGPETRALTQVVLGKDPFVFAAAKSHALGKERGPLRLDALDGESVLVLDDGHCFGEQALAYCARSGAEASGWRATSLTTLAQMAAGGLGVTLLPRLAVPVENRNKDLCTRPFLPPVPSRTLVLAWRPGAARERALKDVGNVLQQAAGELLDGKESRRD